MSTPGSGPGRRRPWRRSHIGFSLDNVSEDTGTSHAAGAPARPLWDTWLGRAATVNARRAGFEGV